MRRPAVHRAGRACALLVPVAAALALTGCGADDSDPGPGAVTVGEARALEEAAEMLAERRQPDAAAPAADAPPAKTPAPRDE